MQGNSKGKARKPRKWTKKDDEKAWKNFNDKNLFRSRIRSSEEIVAILTFSREFQEAFSPRWPNGDREFYESLKIPKLPKGDSTTRLEVVEDFPTLTPVSLWLEKNPLTANALKERIGGFIQNHNLPGFLYQPLWFYALYGTWLMPLENGLAGEIAKYDVLLVKSFVREAFKVGSIDKNQIKALPSMTTGEKDFLKMYFLGKGFGMENKNDERDCYWIGKKVIGAIPTVNDRPLRNVFLQRGLQIIDEEDGNGAEAWRWWRQVQTNLRSKHDHIDEVLRDEAKFYKTKGSAYRRLVPMLYSFEKEQSLSLDEYRKMLTTLRQQHKRLLAEASGSYLLNLKK